MTIRRETQLLVGGRSLPLPSYFPSVSSLMTNLPPADCVELLAASQYEQYLVSAYDIATATATDQSRMLNALASSRRNGAVVLLDSGNYEAYWLRDRTWDISRFQMASETIENDLCLCYDNQQPTGGADAIAQEVIDRVQLNQSHTAGTVIPIVHGHYDLLPAAVQRVAERLCPLLVAVPERALGDGVLARARSVRRIREALNELGAYFPLHLLGTGNPLSMVTYSLAGADSYDGLEWCQTIVDHESGRLSHFQHWDLVRQQTDWGRDSELPYIQSALMHNLQFYGKFMDELHAALTTGKGEAVLNRYVSAEVAESLLSAALESN